MIQPEPVSAIVIVKNGARFLAEALSSIQRQTLAPCETLVVDGGSTDGTAEIARSFPGVRYLLQPHGGISNAYNYGIEQAQGELLAFLSYDDLWTPEKLAVQAGYLAAHPECQYAVCRIRYFCEPGDAPPAGFRPEWLSQEPVAYIMETLVARRSLFARVGLHRTDLATGGDTDWFARVFDAHEIGHACDQVLLHKRVHRDNSSLTAPDSNDQLLKILRNSLRRKRAAG